MNDTSLTARAQPATGSAPKARGAAPEPDRWGPVLLGEGRVRFRLWAPDLDALALEIDGRPAQPMTRLADGWFETEAVAEPGARYRFRVSPERAVPDPASRAQAGDVHGWSLLTDPDAHDWRQSDWFGRPWREAVIYELHPGLMGGFAGIAEKLPELEALGITALQLMPVADVTGARNWGYDGVLPYAPSADYGSPADLKAMVDAAHGLGMMVLLDVVYNHFGPEGNYLGAYARAFFDEGVETPWGAAVAVSRGPVARYFIDNARMWIEEYRLDGLRFDAVHAIGNDAFLDAMAAEIRAGAGSARHVHLVLENEGNDAERLSGAYDAQWNDDFHNVVHVLLTGESLSYYADFAERPIEKLARCLREGFIYQGDPSPNHGNIPRGKPSAHLPPLAFVNFLQNHDQVGNRAFGERLTRLVEADRLRAAVALLLLAPFVPMLFMGEEVGSETPFLFFTDFKDDLATAVREGRRREFAAFPAFSDPLHREMIPDPNARDTYERSRPEPGPHADAWRDFYAGLLAIRHARLVPHLEDARARSVEVLGGAAIAARWLLGAGGELVLLFNLDRDGIARADAPAVDPIFATGDPRTGPGLTAWIVPA